MTVGLLVPRPNCVMKLWQLAVATKPPPSVGGRWLSALTADDTCPRQLPMPAALKAVAQAAGVAVISEAVRAPHSKPAFVACLLSVKSGSTVGTGYLCMYR